MQHFSDSDYDHGWDTKWQDMKRYGPFSRYLRRILRDFLLPLDFGTVLDVGCGEGSFLLELASEFPAVRLYGADVSGSAVAIASKRVPDGVFCVMDISEGYLSSKFDVVVCSEVLEHVIDDGDAIDNLAKMTGKYLLISTVQGRMRRFEAGEVGHVRNYEPGELARKLTKAGLAILRTVEWGFPFYSPLYRNFLEVTGGKGTTGNYGVIRRTAAFTLFHVFSLNSHSRGDEIILLAKPNSGSDVRE